jgi:hypothetical protein
MRRLLLGSTLLLASAAAFGAGHPAVDKLIQDADRGIAIMDKMLSPSYIPDTSAEQIPIDVGVLTAARNAIDDDAPAAVREAKGAELRQAVKAYYAAAAAYLAAPVPQTYADVSARAHAREELTKARKMLQLEMQ